MGQCTSNKSKGSLSVKKILSHNKKPKKMERHKQLKESKNEDYKVYPMAERNETSTLLDSNRKKPEKCSKGVAMSFGFKKRPTPVTSNRPGAWEPGITPDPNGNKDAPTSSQKQRVATPKPSRSTRVSQTPIDRANKPTDSPFPFHFSHKPGSRRTSPSPEAESALNRTFTRNITIVTRTEVAERSEVMKNGESSHGVVMRNRTSEGQRVQPRKFTFQTTRLPQPEPIRMLETKTAKTIANNNKKSARMWRQYEERSIKSAASNCNSEVGGIEEHENNRGSFEVQSSENEYIQERPQSGNRLSIENSDSFSFAEPYTPPPLPELPSVFNIEKQDSTGKEKECEDNKNKLDVSCAKRFLELTRPNPFLKTPGRLLLDRDSPQSSSDQEWINGGEAMADEVSLTLSPKHKPAGNPEILLTETILNPATSIEMIDSLKESMHLTLSEEDPKFAAVAISNNTGALLDDEILSPVESLLSCSENEVLVNKKAESPSTDSKDVNEKPSPSPPGSPSIATNSLSLSEDKEDFLIDDEIADQPELVFEECRSIDPGNIQQYIPDLIDKDSVAVGLRGTSYSSDFSPLPLRKKREFLRSANQGSFESMSPCDSICSEDLMMDYDVSQSNEVDNWDRQSSSIASRETTPRSKTKTNELIFNNKNLFKSLTPRHSLAKDSPGNSLRRQLRHRASPEGGGSPKRSHFNSLGVQSVTYDPASESLTLTRANHSAIQHDIIGLKTMLLTLKRVLNESEVEMPLTSSMEDSPMSVQNNNYSNEFRLELSDLRRQVIFLQGQLEDKEKTVADLQKQIDELAIGQGALDETSLLELDNQTTCNAATQTERTRPTSSGIFSLTPSPIDDNNPILRFLVQ